MRCLVTGGGGFLGGAIARRLLARADHVRVLGRRPYPELAALGAECLAGDLRDPAAVRRAAAGCETVFHAAAKVGLWGRYADYYETNVAGTRHVLDACRQEGVRALVFTGSPSVVLDGRDCEGVDESAPYAGRYDSHYSRTKALSEELVLCADSSDLATVSLRPHLIWGPGDPNVTARILERGRAGRLFRLGGLNKLVDTTYVDDAAEAHLLAASRLSVSPSLGGRAYFISAGDPRPIWDVVNGILAAAGLPSVERSVPLWAARAGALACEAAWRMLPGEPPLSRFLVAQLSTAHWFDIGAARRDLGYRPSVSTEEGLRRLKDWLCGRRP